MTSPPMTWDDIAELLAFAAVYDQRKGDELDVKAWLLAAQDARWTTAVATRVVREHYSSGADRPRINPAAITDRIRNLRGRAAESFESPRIPAGLPNHEYPQWLRGRLAEHVDALLEQWAATGQELPRSIAVPAITVRTVDELVDAAPAHTRPALESGVKRINRGPGPNARPTRVRHVDLDPGRLAAARAELDATRPAEAQS